MRVIVVYSVILGVALFGGGGSGDASAHRPAQVQPSAVQAPAASGLQSP
jgi:hypothetical protein